MPAMIATSNCQPPSAFCRCPDCGQVQGPSVLDACSGLCPSCAAWDDLLHAVHHHAPHLWAAGTVLPDLEATTSHQAISEIVEALALEAGLSEQLSETIVKAFLFDQEVASTAIDHGLAMLHIAHPAVAEPVASVARSQFGVDFGSPDGLPAKVFVLLVSPPRSPAEHLRLTAAAARLLREYGRRTAP
jgi:nitrogen PTS system EIIA component